MAPTNTTTAVALLKHGKKVFLLMQKDGASGKFLIQGFKNITDGIRYFEDGYRQAHSRSYEGSMSACINAITFQFRVVEFKDLEELKAKLLDMDNLNLLEVSNVSGYYTVVPCSKSALEVYDKAITPRLI